MFGFAGRPGRIAGLVLLVGVLRPHLAVALDAEKRADIQQLMKEIGTLSMIDNAVDLMMPRVIGNFKKVNPNIPDATWQELSRIGVDELKKSLPELQEPLIAIYDANFSAEEVKQLIVFYASPLGHKVVSQIPAILQQSVALGQAWGERIGPRIAERIRGAAKQKGYNL